MVLEANEATVSTFDRSYLYGDSLYEVMRTYSGRFYRMDEHMSRLTKSAQLCRMVLAQSPDLYVKEMQKTYEVFKQRVPEGTEAYARIIISRGKGKIGFGLNCLETKTLYTIIIQPLDPPTPAQFEKGHALQISSRLRNPRRALDPAMKSGNYLNSLLAFLDAAAEGFDDAVLCNDERHLTEGTTFNLFYARRGIVATPPLDIGILDGITRRDTIRLARELGIEVREVRFAPEHLYAADEVFLTSTIKEVFPVTRVDNRVIAEGKPGPLTRKLLKAFSESVRRDFS